jgi:uncharacterized membrane protein
MTKDNRVAVNIGNVERLVCGMIGGWMLARWLARPSLRGLLMAGTGIVLVYRAATGRSRLYRSLHISGSEQERRASATIPYQTGVKIEQITTIAKPPEELYQFWRNPENLPQVMIHIQSVVRTGPEHSHWVAKGPAGTTIEWDAEVIHDEPNALIAWQSLPDSLIRQAGSVNFKELEAGRGTEVKLTVEYRPAGGPIGAGITYLLGQDPRRQIAEELQRFKQLMESGELSMSAKQ